MYHFIKSIFPILIFSWSSLGLGAQKSNTTYSTNPVLELFRTDQFDWIQPFCEGLALASQGGEMIIINAKGKKQFDFPYDYSRIIFNEERSTVTKNNLYGLIDKKGEVIVEPIFETIRSYSSSIIVGRKDQMDGIYDIKTKNFKPISKTKISTSDHINFIYSHNDKTGVVNINGDTILPFEYQDIKTKMGEYFVVKNENLFGVLNKNNDTLIPIKYDFLYKILLGETPYFLIKHKNKFGLLNKQNNVLIEPENLVIEFDRAGFLFVKKEDSYVIYDKGINVLFKEKYESIRPIGNQKYLVKNGEQVGVFDSKNGDVEKVEYNLIGKFYNNKIIFKSNELYGLLDTNLNIIIKPIYKSLKLINADLITVKNDNNVNLLTPNNELLLDSQYEALGPAIHDGILTAKRNGKWGLINIIGDSLTSFKYDKISKLRNSKYFKVEIDNSSGIVDLNGNVLKECTLDKIVDHSQYLILQENSKFGLIGKNGRSILPVQYDYINNLGLQHGRSYPNLFKVKKDNKIGILNTLSDKSIDFKYDKLEELRDKSIVARIDSKFGLIDPFGNQITPLSYSYLEDNGNTPFIYASTLLDNKSGLIDRQGEVVVPLEYQTIKGYSNSLIAVKKNDLWGFTDKTGKLIIQNKFKSVGDFNNDFCVVKDEKLQGLINNRGSIIIPIKYKYIYPLKDGRFGVTLDGKHGMFDTTGVNILPPIYDRIFPFSHGNTIVKKDNKYGVFNNTGKEILPIALDKIKRKVEKKTVKRFNSVSYTSSPSEFYEVTFEQYDFTTDNDGNCIENCPSEKIMKRIFEK